MILYLKYPHMEFTKQIYPPLENQEMCRQVDTQAFADTVQIKT